MSTPDEAQTVPGLAVVPPTPIGDGEVEWVELRIRMDATLTVSTDAANPTEWIKPGAEGAIRLRGPNLPEPEQLRAAAQYLQIYQLAPALEDVIALIQERVRQQRQGR